MSGQPQHSASDPEAPLRHVVANLEHLRGKGLADCVRQARYRRRRTVKQADGEPAGSLAEVLEAAQVGKVAQGERIQGTFADPSKENVPWIEGGTN